MLNFKLMKKRGQWFRKRCEANFEKGGGLTNAIESGEFECCHGYVSDKSVLWNMYYYKNQFSIIVNLFFWLMLIAYLSSLICRFHIICDGIAVIATYISSSCIALHYRVNRFRQWLKVHLVNSESTQVQYLQVIHRNR